MKRKLAVVLIAIFALATILSGCSSSSDDGGGEKSSGSASSVSEESYTFRISHVVQEDHPSHIAFLAFKEEVEKNSNGRITVEINPNGALGGDAQGVEMVSLNTLEATCIGADSASGFVPEIALIGLPYLFDSLDSARNSLDGDFGAGLNELMEAQNLKVLAWGEVGFRNVSNSKREILKPEDMKGLKIRVMENPLHIELFTALGANPTPMAFTELFTALQQGTVDGQDNPISLTTTSKFYEVQKYETTTEHVYTAAPFIVSKQYFEGLPADLQTVILDASANWVKAQRDGITEVDKSAIQTMEDNGMTVTVLTKEQKEPFIKAAEVIYPSVVEEYGSELIDLAKSYNK